jgi:tetratricopeptide (TPR) repeat protein
MLRAIILSLLLLTPMYLCAAPTEQDIAQAVALFDAAEKNYALQEYEEALSKYKEAYRLSEQPDLLYNIAQCYRQLNRYDEAIKSYQSFLRLGTADDALRQRVEGFIKESEEKSKLPKASNSVPVVEPEKTPSLIGPIALAGLGVVSLGVSTGLIIRRREGNAPQIVRARGYFALAGAASVSASVVLYKKNKKPTQSLALYSTGDTIGLSASW